MNIIVAVDQNWAIGNHGKLLEHVKGDMQQFKAKTTGQIIITGRETLSTFPGGKPLKDRINIILTRNNAYASEDGVIVHSIEELLQLLPSFPDKEVYVVGGASVYNQLLPYTETAYITKFHKTHEADCYFPNLDESGEWACTSSVEPMLEGDLEYTFHVYKRVAKAL